MFHKNISMYEYFVFDNGKTIIYATIEWFTDVDCNLPVLKILNRFSKTLLKWENLLNYSDKFIDFNGCEIVFMVPTDSNRWNRAVVNKDATKFEIFGIAPLVFQEMSTRFNFIDDYQPVSIKSNEEFLMTNKIAIIHINNDFKVPLVYFDIFQIPYRDVFYHTTTPFLENQIKLLLTPEEPYTIYEKLLLPFDHQTWISICVTFLIAFVTVFIINLFSDNIHELVYGKGVETPALNILSTFFGISLNVLPRKYFPRVLLMLFIFFCLVIRTCYQSKLFEFMTTLMRRPPPQSLDDLIKRNYTLYVHENHIFYKEYMIDEVGVNYKNANFNEFLNLYANYSQNESIRAALPVSSVFQHFQESVDKKSYHWLELNNQLLFVNHYGFAYYGLTFFSTALQQTVNQFISSGILQHLFDTNYNRKFSFRFEQNSPTILTLHALAFGFYIWLATFGISIVVFIIEISVWMLKNIKSKSAGKDNKKYQKYHKRVKHCKVYPSMFDSSQTQNDIIKPATLKKFKVHKNNSTSSKKWPKPATILNA
ncbi:hypothetical protein ACKWTF_013337 [Chironomus riparius]